MSRSDPKNPRPAAILRFYLKELAQIHRQGDAREESFYPALAETSS